MLPDGTLKRFLFFGLAGAGVLILGATAFLVFAFPFRREAMFRRMEAATGARGQAGVYRETWFPPGFRAQRVRLADSKGNVLSIEDISLESSYFGLLRKPEVINRVHASGLKLVIPSPDKHPVLNSKKFGKSVIVRELRLDKTDLDIASREFAIRLFTANNLGSADGGDFQIALHNPVPSGDIRSHGRFGPVDMHDAGRTFVSGTFTFQNADLRIRHGITAATLNASGTFSGPLRSLKCAGTADLPEFQVFGSSHSVHIASAFDLSVDTQTGSVAIRNASAHFNATTVVASGDVTDRRVTVDAAVQDGRVEDLLLLFTRRPTPALKGSIRLHGKFIIPPGPTPFLTKLRVDGQFAISQSHFVSPKAQTPIDRLSASGRGEPKEEQRRNPTLTLADIHGSVVTRRGGIATMPLVVYEAPGLRAQLAGTFGLHNRSINMSGVLQTRGKMEDTTSGFKALALKALGPLWPRRASVQTVPFKITGNSAHPTFRIQLH